MGDEGDGRVLHARVNRRWWPRPATTSPSPRSTGPWPSSRASRPPTCSSPDLRRSTHGVVELRGAGNESGQSAPACPGGRRRGTTAPPAGPPQSRRGAVSAGPHRHRGQCRVLRRWPRWRAGRHGARNRRQRLRGVGGGREPHGRVDPRPGQCLAECRVCAAASPSRAPRWPSAGTPGPCPDSWHSPASS